MRLPRISSVSIFRLFLFFVSFALALLIKKVYRPWVYQREIWDLRVADWGPSLFYVFGMMMLIATLIIMTGKLRNLKYQTMAGIIIGAMMYEISHLFRSDRWFSWADLIATIVGGFAAILSEIILSRVEKKSDSISPSR